MRGKPELETLLEHYAQLSLEVGGSEELAAQNAEWAERIISEAISEGYSTGERRGRAERVEEMSVLSGVLHAWMDTGPLPGVHRRAQRKVRHLMPVLAQRLDRAAHR